MSLDERSTASPRPVVYYATVTFVRPRDADAVFGFA
jgi:hypothetical protein